MQKSFKTIKKIVDRCPLLFDTDYTDFFISIDTVIASTVAPSASDTTGLNESFPVVRLPLTVKNLLAELLKPIDPSLLRSVGMTIRAPCHSDRRIRMYP